MPKIDTYTAPGQRAIQEAVRPSPESFGHSAFGQIGEMGKQFEEVGHRIQAEQDKLDLANLAADHEIAIGTVKAQVLQEPDQSKHLAMFKEGTASLQANLFAANPSLSPQVKRAFQVHVAGENARAYLDVTHQVQVMRAERAVADFSKTETKLTERAALETDPTKAAQQFTLLNELRSGMVRSGLMKATDAQKRAESSQDRYWSIYAQAHPQGLLDLVNHPLEGGENIAGMDSEKRNVYVNLAINTLHTQQAQAETNQKAVDKELKDAQEVNKSAIQADVIAGKPLPAGLSEMVRSRRLDGDAVPKILSLQETLTKVPNMALYQRGLATQIETQLSAMRYDNQPFNPAIMDGLQADYLRGHLLKDEFTHLATLARAVQTHKAEVANTPRNSTVAHAVANLDEVMLSANKLTGFSAIGNQATAAAKEYFYRRVDQEPNANPWDIMHDAETRFKPLVEKQQGVSKVDKMLLDDAKVDANAKLGIVSKAVMSQDDRGRKIVSDALKALPAPPEPGFFERLFKKPEKARKAPGVMGE